MQSDLAIRAVEAVKIGDTAYCKFLSANDTGDTGSHQSGLYVAHCAWPILFDSKGTRGENKDKYVRIRWQESFYTESRFIYYGRGTRNEYRITRFGRNFEHIRPECTGDLMVLVKRRSDEYDGYFLSTEDDINYFLESFGMSPAETNQVIKKDITTDEESFMNAAFSEYLDSLADEFPTSFEIANKAREISIQSPGYNNDVIRAPDTEILKWINLEYNLFRSIERARYSHIITNGFSSIEEFIETANMVLNRRKSRAGRSLEHHLAAVFSENDIRFTPQCTTEGKKRPDFIFPGENEYHNVAFSKEHLTFLGAKTTCKDRWRQILNEADKIEEKHLFTLQQGISAMQLEEMKSHSVILVVPRAYINTYPRQYRSEILSLMSFVNLVNRKQQI